MRLLLVVSAMCCTCRAQTNGCTYQKSMKAGSTRQGIATAQSFKGSSASAAKMAYWFVQRLGLQKVPGDVVECGVFRGGTSAVMAVSRGGVPGLLILF